ncbi:MAG: SufE family protein [Pseudomonadota bacterium]
MTNQAQAELIEEFSFLDGWMDRYQYLIDLGRTLSPLEAGEKVDANKLSGCQSQVWLLGELDGGLMRYRANSDAAIVSGLIAVLLRVYDGLSPEEVLATEPEFITALGFDTHLSPTRSNGLAAMLTAIKNLARASLAGVA